MLISCIRLCQVLTKWLQTYPGDFMGHATFNSLRAFLESLASSTWVAHYTIELLPLLQLATRTSDPDRAWALPDPRDYFTSATEQGKGSLAPSLDSPSLTSSASMTIETPPPPAGSHLSMTPSMSENSTYTSISDTADASLARGQPSGARFRSHSDAADTDPGTSTHSSSGSRKLAKQPFSFGLAEVSNAILEIPDDLLAEQIARLAWVIFVDIKVWRIRPVFHQSSMPSDGFVTLAARPGSICSRTEGSQRSISATR
jgi:hypothetical protein